MNRKITILIIIILFLGVVYRLAVTADGNFFFNMDNARDMVDVREIVVLHKLRLTGPTSAIEGLFNGPAWYYLLAIPFILSGGDPYASILMEIGLWVVGGVFLFKLITKWGNWLVIPIGSFWVASNFITLATGYAFNPNPVTLLAPLFIYLLVKYLEKGRAIYGILTWVLGGLFFNFEMNFGVFTPIIILASVILTKKTVLLRQKWFWVGFLGFVVTLLPQVIFDLKHQFIMSKAVLRHLSENSGSSLNIPYRFQTVFSTFYRTFLPTMMNHELFTRIILGLFAWITYLSIKKKVKDIAVHVSLIFIFLPFLGYLILPVTVNTWHWGGEMAVSFILIAYVLKKLMEGRGLSKIVSFILCILIVIFGFMKVLDFWMNYWGKPSSDPSFYRNEIAAIDYVYQQSGGKNFKAYTYLPSVYDYPYQYLFWWYGQRKYGYLPEEYGYGLNKPTYISNKASFSATPESLRKREGSDLVFLIKEPDRNDTRSGWEGQFVKLPSLGKQMVGPLEVEVKKEISQP